MIAWVRNELPDRVSGLGQGVQKVFLILTIGGGFMYKMTKWGKVNNLTVAKKENV